MADVLVLGAGPVGLAAAGMLARRGLAVTVVDRDGGPPPDGAGDSWARWDRPGVAQFHQAHLLLPGGYRILQEHLPEVVDALVANGGVRLDFAQLAPPSLPDRQRVSEGGPIVTVNARRPVLEHAFATAVGAMGAVQVRRGVEVAGYLLGPSAIAGVPHVCGAVTTTGQELRADVVIDATGRSSVLPRRLEAAGIRPPEEDREREAFVYTTRFYRSPHGGIPAARAPFLSPMGSFSILTMPADHDSWSVTIYSPAADDALRAVRHPDTFDRLIRACPAHAHWLDGEPISGINVMTSAMGRRRRFHVDGAPVCTGLVPLGDAWACTNPSLGRGITLGLAHAVEVAALVGGHLDDPASLTDGWREATEHRLGPWYDATLAVDRTRMAQMSAAREGRAWEPDPGDPAAMVLQAFGAAMGHDAGVFRGYVEMMCALALPSEVLGREGFLDRLLAAAEGREPDRLPGPDRDQLVQLLASGELAPA